MAIGLLIILFVSCPDPTRGTEELDYFSMSLEELIEETVSIGSLTGGILSGAPVSVTSITAIDIAATPARNICDLLEIYVPGATYVTHFLGPRLGLRGVAGDQNHSVLLIVDGRNMNLVTRHGPVFELLNMDLRDIARIDVIRGPGSVTYGPGAIAGVINVTTKSAHDDHGLIVGLAGNRQYRQGSANVCYSFPGEKTAVHIYGSLSSARGLDDTRFYYVDRAHGYGYGFMGPDWGNRDLGTEPPPILADYRNRPQVKLNIKVSLADIWRLHGRYTSNSWVKVIQARSEAPLYGGFNRANLTLSLENETRLSALSRLTTMAAFYSANYDEISLYQGSNRPLDDPTQKNAYFSENRLSLRSVWRHESQGGNRFALGVNLETQYLTSPWGKDEDLFILGLRAPIRFAVMDTTSAFYRQYPSMCTLITEDISANQMAIFGEAKVLLSDDLTLLLSGRGDKHEYADWAWSPRVALIKSVDPLNTVKAIWQHSVRLPAFDDLLSIHMLKESPAKPEILNGLELIFNHRSANVWDMELATYFSRINQVAWLPEGYPGRVGTFEVLGVELDINHRTPGLVLGANYSYINQISWDTHREIDAFIKIPDDPADTEYQLSAFGTNRINNLPGQALKFFLRKPIMQQRVIAHIDGRLFWSPGQAEMLDMFKDVHDAYGSEATRAEMSAIYDDLKAHGYAEPMFTSNLSLILQPLRDNDTRVSLFASNVLTHNYLRYVVQYWEEGYLRQYPRQVGFLEEPLTLGLSVEARF
ncbi:MAG: TonB-dependent receptor [bacterium]|nr:TonB-dependent receptor [bacterium]